MSHQSNVDPAELQRFAELAPRWWDPDADSRALHDLNPVRVEFIAERCQLAGAQVLDVGCGGGLLAEALASRGAVVTGIDLGEEVLQVARLHLMESGQTVDYRAESAETHASLRPSHYDVVCCMEMLEHVPNPEAVVAACAQMLKPSGRAFFSTINRTASAFATAVVGAEYLLRLLPRGTHTWAKFIRPSELACVLRSQGLEVRAVSGLIYDPLRRRAWLSTNVAVNYLVYAEKPR